MKAIGACDESKLRTSSRTFSHRRSLSGANPPGMTRASKASADTPSTVVSTSNGPYPFLPCSGLSSRQRDGHRDALLAEAEDRVEQFHLLEQVGGEDEYFAISQWHSQTLD